MAEVDMPQFSKEDFPSNSFSSKQKTKRKVKNVDNPPKKTATEEPPVHEKRVRTVCKATAKKQSLVKKLGKAIVEDSIESVKERAFNEIIVPGIKSLIFDAVTDMADAILFGGTGYSRGYSARDKRDVEERTSYSGYYNKRRNKPRQQDSYRSSSYSMEPDDIFVKTRRKANEALNEVDRCIKKYGQASIADLYDAVELTSDWTDDQYGWKDIRGARIRSVRDGFLIIMPPTVELD